MQGNASLPQHPHLSPLSSPPSFAHYLLPSPPPLALPPLLSIPPSSTHFTFPELPSFPPSLYPLLFRTYHTIPRILRYLRTLTPCGSACPYISRHSVPTCCVLQAHPHPITTVGSIQTQPGRRLSLDPFVSYSLRGHTPRNRPS